MKAFLFAVGLAVLASCGSSPTKSDQESENSSTTRPATTKIQLSNDGTGLVQRTTTKGKQLKLDGRFQNAAIARRNPDGTITTECHDDDKSAEAFANRAPSTVRVVEVK